MEPEVLTIATHDEGDISVVRLTGELDTMNVTDLTQHFADLLDAGRRLFVLDMSGLEFIDSAGLGGLVALWERAMERGSFLAVGAQSARVRDVLQVTGLHSLIQSYDTMDEAKAAVRAMWDAFPQKSRAR